MATRFSNKWLVLGIDLFTIAVSFFLAYLIRFNLSLNFDMSRMALQLPLVLAIALAAYLITGVLSHKGLTDLNTVLAAVGLWSILLILLMVINHQWEIYPKLSIPLSIVILFSMLSLLGLTASRYLFKVMYASEKNNLK